MYWMHEHLSKVQLPDEPPQTWMMVSPTSFFHSVVPLFFHIRIITSVTAVHNTDIYSKYWMAIPKLSTQ